MSYMSNGTRSNVDPVGPAAALNPPTGTPHKMIESLMQELNIWGHANCFGFVKKHSGNPVNGQPSHADIICNHGRPQKSRALVCQTSTTKLNCPWTGIATALKRDNGIWFFRIKHGKHNHEPGDGSPEDLIMHSSPQGSVWGDKTGY